MKSYYILVTSDYHQTTAYEIFINRIKEKKFPLYLNTHNLKIIKKDDEILFYIAGKNFNSQSFVAKSVIDKIEILKEVIIDADKNKNIVNRYLILKDVEIFKEIKKIKSILNDLNFIKVKRFYGAYLVGGVIKINNEDFKKIVNSNN
jgi:hypothetical protein